MLCWKSKPAFGNLKLQQCCGGVGCVSHHLSRDARTCELLRFGYLFFKYLVLTFWDKLILYPFSFPVGGGRGPGRAKTLRRYIELFLMLLYFYFFLDLLFIEITLVYNIIRFMCTTLYLYFCIPYSMLTTKSLYRILSLKN